MQMVKIQIPDEQNAGNAFATLVRRGRIDCYRDNVFIVPEPALEVLHSMSIPFIELGRGGLDYVEKALSDAQRQELDRRIADDDSNPDDLISWEQIKAEALARLKR
jgi:Putative addiction module component